MSSVIDPVTGLPIVVPLNVGLDTIPLGVQTFPWKDYKATQRPNRGMAYPDDIIPVSANVAGMFEDAAQAVGTDGNHALLVSDVHASGGGPVKSTSYSFSVGGPLTSSGVWQTFDLAGPGAITAFMATVVCVTPATFRIATVNLISASSVIAVLSLRAAKVDDGTSLALPIIPSALVDGTDWQGLEITYEFGDGTYYLAAGVNSILIGP